MPTDEKRDGEKSDLPFQALRHPGTILGIVALPVVGGAVLGFRGAIKQFQRLSEAAERSASPSPEKKAALEAFGTEAERRAMGFQVAKRALSIGTLACFGSFGILGAAFFYSNDYRSMSDAVEGSRQKTRSWYARMEAWMKTDEAPSNQHPEVVATRNLSEQEQMNYLYEKYFQQDLNDTNSSSSSVPKKDGK